MTSLLMVRWLVRDTFRQALTSWIFWLMLAVNVACAGVCLTVKIIEDDAAQHSPDTAPGKVATAAASLVGHAFGQSGGAWPRFDPFVSEEYRLVANAHRRNAENSLVTQARVEVLFGMIEIPIHRSGPAPARALLLQIAGWVADAGGMLLALIWTASFLPSFLEGSAIAVLLAKPVPRWALLAGKFIGVVSFVGFQTIIFVLLTWAALGTRTGDWDARYFLCLPVLLVHFAVFGCFSALLAVVTRSTVACVFGSVLFWLLCWGVNFGHHAAAVTPELRAVSTNLGSLLSVSYWVLPKPLDFHFMLVRNLDAENLLNAVLDMRDLDSNGLWHPAASILASALFGIVLLWIAAYEFMTADY